MVKMINNLIIWFLVVLTVRMATALILLDAKNYDGNKNDLLVAADRDMAVINALIEEGNYYVYYDECDNIRVTMRTRLKTH